MNLKDKEIVGGLVSDRIFYSLIAILLEKNFYDAKKKPMIENITEGHENGSAIGLFIVQNSKHVLDYIHEDIVFHNINGLDMKKYFLEHSEPRKDGALIITDTKISDNVFFSGVISAALKNVKMTKIDELMKILLPNDFSHQNGGKIEAGSKTRTALSVPLACPESKSYLLKKSAYKNVEEGTGKAVRFGKFGLEAEFFLAYDKFLPIERDYFLDEKNAIGVVKTYSYNTISKRVENTGKFIINAKKLLGEGTLDMIQYPASEKMQYLLNKMKTSE